MRLLEDIIKKHNIEYEMITIPYSWYEEDDRKIKNIGNTITFIEVSPENLKKINKILKEEKNDNL
jgi:hypothetical protein